MFSQGVKLPFRLLGIPLYLEWSFLVIVPLLALSIGSRVGPMGQIFGLPDSYSLTDGAMPYLLGLTAALGLFLGVLLHELGHAVAARAYGVRVERISLWFLGGVAQFEQMPRQRLSEAVVALAGPAVSFLLAALCWLSLLFIPPDLTPLRFILLYLTSMNLLLGLFNLLPALPLDGGRVLRSVLLLFMPLGRATDNAVRVSRLLAILMGLFGLLSGNFLLAVIAIFVFLASAAEAHAARMEEGLDNLPATLLMNPNVPSIPPETRVDELSTLVWQHRHTSFPVVDFDRRVMGVLKLEHLLNADPSRPVLDYMSPPSTAPISSSASDILRLIERCDCDAVFITDSSSRLVGVVTPADLERAVRLRQIIPGSHQRGFPRPGLAS